MTVVSVPGFLLLCLLLLPLSCAQEGKVTVGGRVIDDPTFITATVVVHDVEAGAVAIGEYLIQRHRTSCAGLTEEAKLVVVACMKATAVLKTYASEYAPKILTALQGARDVLRTIATAPQASTTEKLQAAIALASTALQTATDWATGHGFRKVTL